MSEVRNFNVADSKLISHGGVVASALPADIEDFKAFDNKFSETYPETIQAVVDEVLGLRSDNVVIDEMTELTQVVNDSLAACNTTFKTVRFFVKKAFPTNKAIQNQFGLNDITKIRANVPKMIVFMQDLDGVVQKYKTQLEASGCNGSELDKVSALAEKLRQDNINQEQFKKERGVITQERVDKMNSLYDVLKPVSEIAHIIYSDNSAKLSIYAMPKPKSSTDSEEDILKS
ncbi:hypothetical protein [Labilibacter marinus]|uniref:hypothetical protein n=1 Tax=Labilibacter marinus TaxID=1477105 RepID=UPI00094F9781|nr:hypothetical protein [Labilibacter marinus]